MSGCNQDCNQGDTCNCGDDSAGPVNMVFPMIILVVVNCVLVWIGLGTVLQWAMK